MIKLLFLLPVFLFLNACGNREPSQPANPEVAKQVDASEISPSPYAKTMAALDTGGVHYQLIDGAYEWDAIEPILDFFGSMMLMGFQESNPEAFHPQVMERLKSLPERLGLDEILVMGTSTVKRPEGGYLSKQVVQKKTEATGWMWDLPGEPTDVATLAKQLPATTVLLAHYSLNTPVVYREIQTEVEAFPEAAEKFQKGEAFLEEIGFPQEEVLNSFHQGITLGLTLNDQTSWVIPIAGNTFRIPETGLILMLPDEDSILLSYILEQLKNNVPIPVMQNEVSGIPVNFLPLPLPVSTVVSLQIAHVEGKTLLATSPSLMQELISRSDATRDTPLLDVLSGIENTQASYALIGHSRLGEVYQEILAQMKSTLADKNAHRMTVPMIDFYSGMLANFPQVNLYRSEGDLNISEMIHLHPLSPQYANNSSLTIPMVGGLMAAIAVPSFQRARMAARAPRGRAAELACKNNLRILESAKDQWAIENGVASGARVNDRDIEEYIKNGIPQCPVGGTYTLKFVNSLPSCSIHGSME